jgi:hypothetical protein
MSSRKLSHACHAFKYCYITDTVSEPFFVEFFESWKIENGTYFLYPVINERRDSSVDITLG